MKRLGILMGCAAMVAAAGAAEKTARVFSDDFTTHMTFSENWIPDDGAPVKSADGAAVFGGAAKMTTRMATPAAFRAEAKFKVAKGRAGFRCGEREVSAAAGEEKTLVLDCLEGAPAGAKLFVFAEGEAVMDDFSLSVPAAADASPNLVINSGFERQNDGFPLYVARMGNFDYANWREHSYEEYLALQGVDESTAHSGKYSYRMTTTDWCREGKALLKRAGSRKGARGVMSAYVKADRPGLKAVIEYGAKKVFEPTTEWTRYEVACTNLPAENNLFSAASFGFATKNTPGTLWFDDIQCEIIEAGELIASPYRPSDQDATRFKPQVAARAPGFAVPKLAAGVKPTVDLDAWIGGAAKTDSFFFLDRAPTHRTEAFFAVDDENFYAGVRCHGEKFVPAKGERQHDKFDIFGQWATSCELFLDPAGDKNFFQFAFNDQGYVEVGAKRNVSWNGEWIHDCRANAAADAVDYFFAVPLRHFASSELQDSWPVLVGRNDGPAYECVAMCKCALGGYQRQEYWPVLELPPEVIAKYRQTKTAAAEAARPELLGHFNFYMNEPKAAWRVRYPDGRRETVELDIAAMPCGINEVTVAGVKTTLVKRPYRKGAAQINQWARCVVQDGEPVMHVAPFLADMVFGWPSKKYLDGFVAMHKERGFTDQHFLMGSKYTNTVNCAYNFMDACREHGQRMIVWTDWQTFCGEYSAAELAAGVAMCRPFIEKFKGYDNITSMLLADEPELSCKSEDIRAYLEAFRPEFPYHPVQMNNTVMGIPNNFADLKTDILMLDAYLTADEGTTVAGVIEQVDVMRKAGAKEGKPCYYFLVGGNFPLHYREPGFTEQLAQSWGAVCAGCTGISWFYGKPQTPGNWRAMCQFVREVKPLTAFICSDEECGEARPSVSAKAIRTLTKTHNGETLVATCNVTTDPFADVVFTLPADLPQSGTIEVLYENRSLPLENGRFTDSFPALTRHIYRVK